MVFPLRISPINLPCYSSTSSHVPGTRARRYAIRAYAIASGSRQFFCFVSMCSIPVFLCNTSDGGVGVSTSSRSGPSITGPHRGSGLMSRSVIWRSAACSVNLLSKVTLFCRPIMIPLRDGRTVGEEPQPDQPQWFFSSSNAFSASPRSRWSWASVRFKHSREVTKTRYSQSASKD